MNLFKHTLLAALLISTLGLSANLLADEVPNARAVTGLPVATAPVDRMQMMQTMRTRMHEMMQTTDPAKRKELMEAQMQDMDAMSTGGMGMIVGPGGRMMGPGAGMMPSIDDRPRHDDAREQRLNALEKRLDMMQMVLHLMLSP